MASPSYERLKTFFETSAAARRATRPLKKGASVAVTFPDDPEPYRFTMESGSAGFVPGRESDPDFSLVLPPKAVEEITGLEADDLGSFAVAFFKCILADEDERKVHVKLHAGFIRLTRHGYLSTMALGGPTVMMFLARQGLKGPGGIKKAIDKLRKG